jgi:hypothetical protein
VQFAPGLNALVDAAAEHGISRLTITGSAFDMETVPALARLLQRSTLTRLKVISYGFRDAPEASVLELCVALRACRTLTFLQLCANPHPHTGASRRVVTELLDAAAALPVLSDLALVSSRVQDTVAFGRGLGGLLRANLPSLRRLYVSDCHLDDLALAPLLDGLAANTHLRKLECSLNDTTYAFKRDRLMPALEALEARPPMPVARADGCGCG